MWKWDFKILSSLKIIIKKQVLFITSYPNSVSFEKSLLKHLMFLVQNESDFFFFNNQFIVYHGSIWTLNQLKYHV